MNIRLTRLLQSGLLFLATAARCIAGDDGAASDLRRAQALSFNCFTCHGPHGEGPGAMKPLIGLSAGEIRSKLLAFKRDEGDPTIMNRIARGYSDEEIAVIADYLAGLDGEPPGYE